MFRDKAGNLSIGRIILAAVVLVALIALVGSSFTVIPAGHTGVVLTFGRVNDVVLQEGLHFKLPFAQQIVTIDNRIVKLEVTTEAFSKDLQTVSTVLAVNYRVNKDQSQNIYKEIGPNFEDVLITPVVNEVLKAVTAQYTAVDLVGSRVEVSVLLNEGLNSKLNEYGIYVNELNIINWDFSAEYIAAVEAKQVAEQNLIKTRTEQEQALVIANTEAEKRVIAAEAEANEIKVLAEANAESNRILTESLTELLLQYQSVQKWDGKLPTVMAGGENTLIDIPLPVDDAS
jgi:regulator of protease activity HflC (stomatin/prohibitin superfamily)